MSHLHDEALGGGAGNGGLQPHSDALLAARWHSAGHGRSSHDAWPAQQVRAHCKGVLHTPRVVDVELPLLRRVELHPTKVQGGTIQAVPQRGGSACKGHLVRGPTLHFRHGRGAKSLPRVTEEHKLHCC